MKQIIKKNDYRNVCHEGNDCQGWHDYSDATDKYGLPDQIFA